ncbi:hypothetical protein HQ560_03315, partial [bacterium]|nr:hypothetical protein [bacterium]
MRHGPILAGFLLALAGISALARDDHEPNNTPAQATSVKSGAVLQASIHPVKDVDHFVITVPEPGIGYLDVTVRDVPAAIAPLVQILGPDGKELDKAQRPSAAPLFHRILLEAAGKHTIVLRDGQGNWQDKLDDKASEDLLSVEVRFTPISQAFEPNNALAQAKALPLRKAVQATLFPKDDVDYYTVTVPEPGHGLITIRLSDIPEAMNPGIWALDAKGKVKENRWQQRVSGEVVLPIHVRAPGSLTFVVGTRRPDSGSGYYYSRRHASLSLYTLRVDYAPARDAAEPNDEAKTATPLPLGEAKAAVLFPAGDVDAYTIDIPAPGRLDVTLTRVDDSIAPRLTLFGPDGKAIDRAQRAQGAELHTQRELAAPGAYVLHVQDGAVSAHGYSDREHDGYALAPYTLRAVFTPAPDANEPNGSHDTAKAVARDTAVQAAIFPVGDTDFYKFTVPPKTRGVARIRVAGLNDKLVPRIRLFDGAKREIQKAVGGRERAAVLTRGLVAGDYFVQVHDSDFHNGAGWERANDSSSVEAYSFVVAFEPVPHAQAEPNDTFEQAEPIVFGQERQASIFPAGDGDIYKVEIAEAGPIRIRVGDFMSDIRARLNLYGPDKKLMLALDRHAPRAILDAEIKKPGAYYVQVHPVSFSRGGHSFSAGAQFDVAPYSVLVSRLASPAAGAAEREPNDAMAAAQPIRPGQTLTCRIDKARDRDWFAFALDAPAHVDIELLHAPPELDLIVDVFRRAPGTQLPEKNVLYLTGHREYNLHDHFPDIRFTAFGAASAEAKAAFANPALMGKYDAIVVDCLPDPKQIDLGSPRVQANIQAYVQGGGRFMMFAPVFALEHFGLEGVAPGWDEGAVVDLGVKHPILQEGVERRVRGWRGSESGGHLKGWRASGYQMLFAHASDPERHAVTVAKKIGAGYLIVDTQTVGYYLHWPVADWKFRSYLGVPQVTHVGRFTDTLRPRGLGAAGAKERARIRAWEPGTYFISIHDPNASRKSDKPYTLSVAVTPIVAPPPAVSALAAAKPITLDAAGKAAESLTLSGTRQRAWFRVQGKASATLSVALGNVPPNVDPQITVYESVDPKADLTKPKRVLYLHGNRADLNLDRHAPGVAFERIEWNDARAPAILLRPENLAGYAAVVVEGMTRPEDFGLNLAAAAA